MIEGSRVLEITKNPDETLRWILIDAAQHQDTPPPSLPVGYARNLDTDLARFSPLLPPLEKAEKPDRHLFRLYAFLTEETNLALMMGHELDKNTGRVLSAFPATTGLADRPLTGDTIYLERDWGLIGMAIAGWVILFSDSVTLASRMSLHQEGVNVAFIPARETWLEQVGPEVTEKAILSRLLPFIFEALPEQEE